MYCVCSAWYSAGEFLPGLAPCPPEPGPLCSLWTASLWPRAEGESWWSPPESPTWKTQRPSSNLGSHCVSLLILYVLTHFNNILMQKQNLWLVCHAIPVRFIQNKTHVQRCWRNQVKQHHFNIIILKNLNMICVSRCQQFKLQHVKYYSSNIKISSLQFEILNTQNKKARRQQQNILE